MNATPKQPMRDHIWDFMHAWDYWDWAVTRKTNYNDWATRLSDAGYAFQLVPSIDPPEMRDWLDNNVGGRNYVRLGNGIWFNDDADAALFTLMMSNKE